MAISRSEVANKLSEVLEMVTGSSAASFDEQSRLIEDVGLNSVGVLYIAIGIEEFFGVRFDDVGFGDFVTVGDVLDYIESKLQA